MRCNICGSDEFIDFNGRVKVMCKNCQSLERHRSFRAALSAYGWLDESRKNARILHLSPELCTYSYMAPQFPGYIACDANPAGYPHARCLKLYLPKGFDIFPDEYFDLIIHNHVLEHIPGDYRLHMLEFQRLLAPGGQMIFTLPVGMQPRTIQDGENMATDAQRRQAFGQADHYKSFGQDFLEIFAAMDGEFKIYRVPSELEKETGPGNGVFCFTKTATQKQHPNHGRIDEHHFCCNRLQPWKYGVAMNEIQQKLVDLARRRYHGSYHDSCWEVFPLETAIAAMQESNEFNVEKYRAENPDIDSLGLDPITHWMKYGLNEGKSLKRKDASTIEDNHHPIRPEAASAGGSEKSPEDAAQAIWNDNMVSEILFWKPIIRGTHANKERCEFMRKFSSPMECAPAALRPYLAKANRILDVGAGPVSVLGSHLDGKPLNIIAIDPLAREYEAEFEKAGYHPLIKTCYGTGEELDKYVSGRFEVVFSRNALDHGHDPARAISKMLDVCAPGGIVRLENVINEGEHENYAGLHQFNFMPDGNELIIWNRNGYRKRLSEELAGRYDTFLVTKGQDRWVYVEIGK